MRVALIVVACLGSLTCSLASSLEHAQALGSFEDAALPLIELSANKLPQNVNWTELHAVTPVTNQGHFNNSWAFAAVGVVESRKFIQKGKLVPLSAQNLIDCCQTHKRRISTALKCIQAKGINTASKYPYRGLAGKCRFSKLLTSVTKIKKMVKGARGSETKLAADVYKGPVAAVISSTVIANYKSGIYFNPSCGRTADLPVLIVGYGHNASYGDYWLLKTSLGTQWGERGYMRLARNRNNMCGIADDTYYPTF
ncbi:cathepsin L1-like [Drosophila busckii]|uniref:cathepsin L1-like n=1 Tax=Drosophila busckii TaxID=30019 RepID=UPI00083EC52F|nr:cathepsin L1-like [Drosophila busckii]